MCGRTSTDGNCSNCVNNVNTRVGFNEEVLKVINAKELTREFEESIETPLKNLVSDMEKVEQINYEKYVQNYKKILTKEFKKLGKLYDKEIDEKKKFLDDESLEIDKWFRDFNQSIKERERLYNLSNFFL